MNDAFENGEHVTTVDPEVLDAIEADELEDLSEPHRRMVEAVAEVTALANVARKLRDAMQFVIGNPAMILDGGEWSVELKALAQRRTQERTYQLLADIFRILLSCRTDLLPLEIRRRIDIYDLMFGLNLVPGESMTAKARRHGITKQALANDIARECRHLGIAPPVTRGNKQHTHNNQLRNFRHGKKND